MQMAQQRAEAARKDLAALQAAAPQGGAGDDPSSQAAAAEASLQDKQTRMAALDQRVLDIEDRIYAPLSEAVRSDAGVHVVLAAMVKADPAQSLPWQVMPSEPLSAALGADLSLASAAEADLWDVPPFSEGSS